MTYSYDRILDDIKTVEDLRLASSEVDMLLVALYKSDTQIFQDTLNTKLQRNLADSLTQSLTEQNIALTDHQALESYFQGLKEFIKALPILQLTLAYHPSNQHIEQLTDWARRETKNPIILQLNYNKDILGGAIITYDGRYTDLSLRKRLEGVYQTKQAEILKMLA